MGGKTLYARSRIMFARAEMKHYRLRGRGGEDLNEITICNAHLHSQTAARRVNNSAEKLRDFFDRLARACQKYDPRFICADLNMQLYNLVPEMRARGFCIQLAAFYVIMGGHTNNDPEV